MLADAIRPGEVFVDVGANVGYFAVPIARIVGPAGRVEAFEPAPDSAAVLRSSATDAGLTEVISVHETALGSEDGSLVLHADASAPEDSTKRSLFVDGPAVGEVPVRTFDGLVASGAVDAVRGLHAVKIDVEGAEVHVLAGMRRSLSEKRPRIVIVETIESHLRRTGASVADVHAFMKDLGYRSDPSAARSLELNAVFVA